MAVVTERAVLTEILQIFQNTPCLWNTSHPLYTKKNPKEQCYLTLLEKYRLIEKDATLDDLKRKIANMRATYKREFKKVLHSKIHGQSEYKPTLWYYNQLAFLNNVSDFSQIDEEFNLSPKTELLSENEYEEVPTKRFKTSPKHEDDMEEEDSKCNLTIVKSEPFQDPPQDNSNVNSSISFGNTVGLQLNDLKPTQRAIAEKLISEVIFYGRLDKLSTNTSVELNEIF